MPGELRIRVRYKTYKTPWFDYLLASPEEMEDILDGTGWHVARFFKGKSSGYCALIEKD